MRAQILSFDVQPEFELLVAKKHYKKTIITTCHNLSQSGFYAMH